MLAIFLKTLPFFTIIGLGYVAGRVRFFPEEATTYLTKFVFYFALPAMLFRFSATLSFEEILDWQTVYAILAGSLSVYFLGALVAKLRGQDLSSMAVEAQCCAVGNVGFLGIPMLVQLFGEASIGPIMLVLIVDSVVFGSIIVIMISAGRDGQLSPRVFNTIGRGLLTNPMIMAILVGIVWSLLNLPTPAAGIEFLTVLGSAATPVALFAIGASLAGKSTERMHVAGWLSFCKLVVHPAAMAGFALWWFDVDPFGAAVIIAAAALPVAGNIFIQAQHYGVAPQRVSASILISTTVSIVSVSIVIGWVTPLVN